MHHLGRFVVCALWLASTGLAEEGRNEASQGPSAIELQAECLQYREKICKHGQLSLHLIDEQRTGPKAGRKEAEYRIFFSGERLRFDVRNLSNEGKWTDWEHYIVDGDRYVWVPEGRFEGVIAPASEYQHSQEGVVGHFSLFHPRWLGMGQNSESLMHREPRARSVSPTKVKAVYEVVASDLKDIQVLKVTRKTSFPGSTKNGPRTPGEFVMWFAPQCGTSLVRAELREFAQDATIVRSVESDLEQFPEIDAWFPRTIVRETSVADKVTRRQTIDVREATFGSPPEEKVFTIAGLNLPKGKQISDRSQGPRETVLRWDGNRAVAVRGAVQFIDPADSPRQFRWLFIGNVVLVVLLTVWFAARYIRNRSRQGFH